MPNPQSVYSQALIVAATNGDAVEVARLIPLADCRFNGSMAIRRASAQEHHDIVRLLAPHSDVRRYDSIVFRRTAGQGNIDLLRFLLPHSDPNARQGEALAMAVSNEHHDIVDLLLPLVDVTADPDRFIEAAARTNNVSLLTTLLETIKPTRSYGLRVPAVCGYIECFERLLPYCDVSDHEYLVWRGAIHSGQRDIVRILLNHLDPNVGQHVGLRMACVAGHTDLMELLFEKSDRTTVMHDLLSSEYSSEIFAPIEGWLAEEQKQRLEQELDAVAVRSKSSRM